MQNVLQVCRQRKFPEDIIRTIVDVYTNGKIKIGFKEGASESRDRE